MPCLVDGFSNKRLVFQWERFVLRYSPICFYILTMQTSSMDFKNKDRKLDQSFNSIFCYIDDVLSLSNSRFGNYLHHIDAMSLKLRILLILKSLLLTLTFTLIEVIATKIIWSSSRSGWSLLNIHISNNNGSFILLLSLSLSRFLPELTVYMSNMAGVL